MRRKIEAFVPKCLPITLYGSASYESLLKGTRPVKEASRLLKTHIDSLTLTAKLQDTSLIHSAQCHKNLNLFLIQQEAQDFFLSGEAPFKVYINPSYKARSPSTRSLWESNLSFYWLESLIERYESIEATYLNAKLEAVTEPLSGMEARLFQQALDLSHGF